MAGTERPVVTVADMERQVARYAGLKGGELAFLDQRLPEHRREIINIIGFSVTENRADPDLAPKIERAAHGFAMTYIHADPGCGAALHAHPTEEVFVALREPWEVYWLEGDTERSIRLEPFDQVSVPIGIFRGFRCVGAARGLMMAVVGGPDPGHVEWHPSVLARARETGLSVDEAGNLRETAS